MSTKILILIGGPVRKLDTFIEPSRQMGLDVTLASFSDTEYISTEGSGKLQITIKDKDLAEFDLIYIRMVGIRMEDASLVTNYAREKGIKIVDRVYRQALFIPSTISKAMEMKKLINAGIPLPQTYFASLSLIRERAPKLFSFPFVIKSTSGKKARDSWLVESKEVLESLVTELREREKQGIRFFAQKLIKASQRIRVLVVGGKVIGAISRPTKWRKHFTSNNKEGKKEALIPVPEKYSELALNCANAVNLDIAGVDILEENDSGKLFVIEANAAPSWNLIKKDCGVEVEKEILNFLASL
ncbi:hypothetical protein A2715_00040 [Candidatus Woesebacteria bacterium RIFCSPHIGHO2_01_FULL_39_32]|uniref:ATP-grasp domain-containing protein n=1 Tax=Candidatus Woesebacteria bacterium RIFCSPLOWO2_01_FULL_39_25 TaxID=1802521 RepID=A0A1F8BNG0_9BACT|nr:MAG: Alpha-L-glutamate ligase, RimK family [Parcubacteria group bacterium GW2011_GWA1_38_7]OGM03425.1 MAG: hypothetical protein A2124_01745 [Candidatus Woesebacteria bacterium GWB1_37_5]OGM24955.1 MAG: hypothetical protein A2715_00040 [Candidatus Woesebacteria bacterium RIFCSPHIGHO2_01_FULL_39_32]OGM35486.1 MAG: hypothetical protein A3F01_02380 [Candidatus Woesebacteria bacterium RIFCSPHIGHO2_12_FULL_38_11]OGM65583.1 MAG: hypothetical protein A2893_01500 [Candidatus Woesebacteria bacterium R